MAEHNFKEKKQEYSKKSGMIPVWQSPKYLESKAAAIAMIESGNYGLTDGDFWILMNEAKGSNGPMMVYTGLIISHNGCMKINDHSEKKVIPFAFRCQADDTYGGSLIYTYCDDDVYEVGEVSANNCKNNYPYAMAFKRCYDRVVLKKSKLAYSGIYSESEADEFKQPLSEEEKTSFKNEEVANNQYRSFIDNVYFKTFPEQEKTCLKRWKIHSIDDIDSVLTKEQIDNIISRMKVKLAKKNETGIFNKKEETF